MRALLWLLIVMLAIAVAFASAMRGEWMKAIAAVLVIPLANILLPDR